MGSKKRERSEIEKVESETLETKKLGQDDSVEDVVDAGTVDEKMIENKVSEEVVVEEAIIETFEGLGIHEDLCRVLKQRGWTTPTPIQMKAIPAALSGRDIIGLAVTGSGKTGAFALPILQSMISAKPQAFHAIAIAPTRELCIQIAEQFKILGSAFQLKIATLVGGLNAVEQTKDLARQPHIIVATPGRLVDHLQNTKGFSLSRIQFLVLDEADRLLSLDFEEDLHLIIKGCNPKRQTFLFSATMTSKLSKLQRASLQRPVKVNISICKLEVNDTIRRLIDRSVNTRIYIC